MSQTYTVNDQSRTYKQALATPFENEVKAGKATAFNAVLTPSDNVPEEGTSYMLRKTAGGSGTLAGSQKVRDVLIDAADSATVLFTAGIHFSMSEDGDITHLGDLIMAQATELTANSCAKLKELCNGVHDG